MSVSIRTAAALSLALLAAGPAGAATLSFSGGVDLPPVDFPSYFKHVYCDRLPPGGASRDPNCRAVARWIAFNAGRPSGAWSPPPSFD